MPEAERTLLAIETSGDVGSVAVGRIDERGRVEVDGREFLGERGKHAAGAVPAIGRVLESTGRTRTEVDAVIVGSGPGSFTGVRVAAAIAKGFASALGLPLHAISSLAAAAWTEVSIPEPREHDAERVQAVLFDARGGRLFAASYTPDGAGLRQVVAPRFTTIDDVLGSPEFEGALFAGEGAVRNAEAIEAAGRVVLQPPVGFPSADGLIRAFAHLKPAPVDLSVWEPDYLRATSAERERRG